jgi:methionyl-tRNA synthetase
MPQTIFIGVAWPYANGPLHLGHVAGCYLPADIFARYHRARGNDVLMVSGSDEHGTPITIQAEQEGTTPAAVSQKYHDLFLETWPRMGMSWDLYTRTGTENHKRVTQDIFLRLLDRGYIFLDKMQSLNCPKCNRFLPDRYVEGKCPHCGSPGARGDECDSCGRPLNAEELIEPRCRLCGGTPALQETEHFFLDLPKFSDQLSKWIGQQRHWKPNVLAFTQNIIKGGLRPRPITRDLKWGIPVPVKGFEGKRIYVWFENVIGYLSASIEWAAKTGDPALWRKWWSPPAKSYYFIGKDNIFFHTLSWPAALMGYDDLLLPYDVPANEHLTLEHRPLSTSRNWAIWLDDFLSRYDADSLRYMLSANMPESADTDFSWYEFVRRNNDELVATYGNFVHRALSFIAARFDGRVPDGEAAVDADRNMRALADQAFAACAGHLENCRFRAAIGEAMNLAREGNKYIDARAPWHAARTDRADAAASLFTCVQVIAALKTMLYPFLPFSSQRLHEMLGLQGRIGGDWKIESIPAGHPLGQPAPLFVPLEDKVVEEELQRLHSSAR